jgi:hypothetical protein
LPLPGRLEGVSRPGGASAGHGPAFLHQVAVEGHQAVLAHELPGGGHVLDDQRVTEDVGEGRREPGVEVHEVVREVDHPGVLRRVGKVAVLHLRQREEGRPAGVPGLQVLDTPLPDAVVGDHDVGHPPAGGGLTGLGVVPIHAAQLRDRSVDALDRRVADGRDRPAEGAVPALVGPGFELGVLRLGGFEVRLDAFEVRAALSFLRLQVLDDPLDLFLVLFGLLLLSLKVGDPLGQFLDPRFRVLQVLAGRLQLCRAATGLVQQAIFLPLEVVAFGLGLFQGRFGRLQIGPQVVVGRVDRVDLGLDGLDLRRQVLFLAGERGLLDFQLPNLGLQVVDLLLLAVDLDEGLAAGLGGLLDALFCALDPVLQAGDLAADLLHLPLERELFLLAGPLDLGLQVLQVLGESGDSLLALGECLLAVRELGLPVLDVSPRGREFLAALFEFGQVAIGLVLLFLLAEALVLQGGLPLLGELVEALFFLLDAEFGLADVLADLFELLEGVRFLPVELRDAGDFVDDLPALVGGHLDDAGHVPLHHHVVPFRGDPGRGQQVLDVREVHRAAVEIVVGVVVVLGLLDPPLDPDLVDLLDGLGSDRRGDLGGRDGAVTVVECHLDVGLANAVVVPVRLVGRIVDEVGELLGAHPAGPGQAQGEQDGVDDVRLPRAVRAADGGEVLVEGDPGGPSEALEILQDDLCYVHRGLPDDDVVADGLDRVVLGQVVRGFGEHLLDAPGLGLGVFFRFQFCFEDPHPFLEVQ